MIEISEYQKIKDLKTKKYDTNIIRKYKLQNRKVITKKIYPKDKRILL